MIVGLGTDIVSVDRIRDMIERHPAFLKRAFTPAEQNLADNRRDRYGCYAGRWAAKEAAAKALGCGIGKECALVELEIINDPVSRAPILHFSGNAAKRAASIGCVRCHLSVSHEEEYAVATVILEK